MERKVENESRLNKSITNVATGGVLLFLTLLLNFVVRIVFVRTIGYSYLGISSLFTNILTVLSVADLGFGTSISISLYAALRKADEKHIAGIITYYRRIYFIIGMVVFVVGSILRPFVGYIVNTETPIPNLDFYFFIFLVNLVSTYFISYRHAIIKADQKNGIINTVQSLVLLGKSIIELIVIATLPHVMEIEQVYTIYLIVMVVSTYVSEIWCSILAKKMYPYAFKKVEIPKEEKKEISKNVKSLLLYKVCNAVNKSIDSILISILVSTTILGKYSNYTLIIGVLMGFGALVSRNSIASLGNYVLTESKEKQAEMFHLISFVHIAIAAFFIVNYVGILEPFFHFVFGGDSTLSIFTLVLTAIHIGFELNYQVNELFRETTKMFRKIPYISAINLVLNIILSIVLGHFFGLEGIIAGTLIAYFLTSFWFETFALFKHHLQMSSKKVWLKLGYAVLVIGVFATGSFLITNHIQIADPMYKLAFSIGVSFILSIICILTFFWFKEFKRVVVIAKHAIVSVYKATQEFLSNKKVQMALLVSSCLALAVLVAIRDLKAVEIDKLIFVGLIVVCAALLKGEYFISYFFFLIPFHSGLPTGYTYIILAGLFLLKNIKLFKNWRLLINYLLIPTMVLIWELIRSKQYGQMTSVTDALQVFSALLFASFLIYDRKSISKRPLFVFAIGCTIVGLIILIRWYQIAIYVTNHTNVLEMTSLKDAMNNYRFGNVLYYINHNERWYISEYPYKVSMFLSDNQNYLGFLFLAGIMCCSYLSFKDKHVWRKPLCILMIIVLAALGFYTGSKSFFICLGLFIVAFLLSLSFEKHLNPLMSTILLGVILIVVFILCDKVSFVSKNIIDRLTDDSERFSLIREYYEFIISDNDILLFGVGSTRMTDLALATLDQPPHNAIIQIMGGYGVIGLGIIVVSFFLTIFGSKLIKGKAWVSLTPAFVFVVFSMTSQIFFPPNTLLYGLPLLYIVSMNSNNERLLMNNKKNNKGETVNGHC
ncbi:MAG: hypothetical protein J5666_09175 [Bacilli bacterium]|nr:hypothetical protein [Bacilli bacterium]